MRVHKGTAVIVGATVLALGLAACSSGKSSGSGSSGSSSSKPTGTLIYGEGSDFPDNLLGLISAGNVTSVANIVGRVNDGAFRIAPNISYQLDTDQVTSATSTLVNGQQVVDLKINPKAVWDDGQPITADDYIFTWNNEKSQDPAKGGCAALLNVVGYNQIESAAAVSDKEVKFTFIKDQPYADWQGLFSGGSGGQLLLSKHVFDKGSPTANCDEITKGWPIAERHPGRYEQRTRGWC